ncbi:hypothetical protein GO730_16470 [Spirosoma sp. HMF3257]|uniref:Uma2 family endonuclease n=1 Tax=Spirosoma telluris TaxID=2183553 RepID=A0A327NKN9_9BACT|nr:hypothetical protein [Spirosoma telluris]RAI75365.1 hypothetical protein HMF3257_16410 [Spirosoma telluris]
MDYPNRIPQKFLVMEDEMGVNAPITHQRVISKLHVELGVLYYHRKSIAYEPLPETMLGEGISSRDDGPPTPDLILYDAETEQTRVIIEVCHTRAVKSDLDKVIRLIEGGLYGILEGFVYNYKTAEWYRYRLGNGGLVDSSALSDILNLT